MELDIKNVTLEIDESLKSEFNFNLNKISISKFMLFLIDQGNKLLSPFDLKIDSLKDNLVSIRNMTSIDSKLEFKYNTQLLLQDDHTTPVTITIIVDKELDQEYINAIKTILYTKFKESDYGKNP